LFHGTAGSKYVPVTATGPPSMAVLLYIRRVPVAGNAPPPVGMLNAGGDGSDRRTALWLSGMSAGG
jgi:hypothetical protein